MVKHAVQNYSKWKQIFDKEDTAMKAGGCLRFGLYRDETDANNLVVFLEFDSAKNAKTFCESDRIKNVMQAAGVIGRPEIIYLNQLEKKTVLGVAKENAA